MMMRSKVATLLLLLVLICSCCRNTVTAQEEAGTCNNGNHGECTATSEETPTTFTTLGKPTEYTESSQGLKLAVRRWSADEPKAVILFVHGGAGFHSGYSEILGQYMKSNGITMIAYDQAGSGHSESLEGKRQYFDSMDTVADDFNKILSETRTTYPGKKVFAVGESFGATILLHQILREQKRQANSEGGDESFLADGYVFSGPVVKVLPEMLPPAPVIAILKFVAKFFPKLKMPGVDVFSTFDLAFGDKRWAEAGWKDPFIHEAQDTPPRLGQVASILGAMGNNNNHLEDVKVPFKVFMGENEGRVDVNAVKKLAEVASSKDKSIEIIPGAYHQLYQDMPNVTKSVCDGVRDWVLARS